MEKDMLAAISEITGRQYNTLADAIGWYGAPFAWVENYTAELHFKPGKAVFKSPLRRNYMAERILRAWRETHGENYPDIETALQQLSRAELLECWLNYEGIIGYTDLILSIMEELGYDISRDE